jgi:hypothetical protein
MYPWWDVTVAGVKVVFIETTAGDAGYLNGPTSPSPYYLARENGAERAARFLADFYDTTAAPPTSGHVTVNGHTVFRYAYKNIVMYFLRLPDTTLATFEAGGSSRAVDSSTIYTNWKDLTNTMTSIVKTEAKGTGNVWLNTQDNSTSTNPGDNTDHYATGDASTTVQANLPCVNMAYYVGYADANLVNVVWPELGDKTGDYANYVSGQSDAGWPGDWSNNIYFTWLRALYLRGVAGNGQACAF